MAVNRRTTLKIAGAGVAVAAGGVVARAWTQGVFSVGQGPAYEPWKTWRADQPTGPARLVRAAVLAANPHNSQPWLFRVGEAGIDVFADTARNIGTIDPYLREMYMGVGCALENLVLAAANDGYSTAVKLLPDPVPPSRDYFRVETRAGLRFWVYRDGQHLHNDLAPRWYLHGMFA